MSWLRGFDSFVKIQDDVRIKTTHGAAVSLIALLLMLFLFFTELGLFLSVGQTNHLVVDNSRSEKLRINFDFTFTHLSCSLLSVDVMDNSGSHQEDVEHTLHKKRIDKNGLIIGVPMRESISSTNSNVTSKGGAPAGASKTKQPGYCGDCYGAKPPGECCNTCSEVRLAYQAKAWAFTSSKSIEQCVDEGHVEELVIMSGEGCHVYGYLDVNKVAGNMHFAPGKSFSHNNMHIHDLQGVSPEKFNLSHTIEHLSFGEHFPGIVNPLDKTERHFQSGGGVYMYYIKVVRTTYKYISGNTVISNQFSVTEHHQKDNSRAMPAVFINYDLSPIMVMIEETRPPFFHFITQLCGILGGVFTIAGLVDRFVYATVKQVEKKM